MPVPFNLVFVSITYVGRTSAADYGTTDIAFQLNGETANFLRLREFSATFSCNNFTYLLETATFFYALPDTSSLNVSLFSTSGVQWGLHRLFISVTNGL